MRPSAIAVDFSGSTTPSPERTSSDFEEISYPPSHHHHDEELLPLHYMNEEKARRRVVKGPSSPETYPVEKDFGGQEDDDDDGKDVYSKMRASKNRVGSGRAIQPPLPPPTSIVCVSFNISRNLT